MFFEKLLTIEQNYSKLEVVDQSEFRLKIYNEFVKMSNFQKFETCICSICSKTEMNKDLCLTFDCWHSYHIDCLSKNYNLCPQCELLQKFYK